MSATHRPARLTCPGDGAGHDGQAEALYRLRIAVPPARGYRGNWTGHQVFRRHREPARRWPTLTSGKSYEVQVRAKNDEGESPWATPARPSRQGGTYRRRRRNPQSVPENSAAGTNVGAPVTATANPIPATRYSHTMTGTDAGKFHHSNRPAARSRSRSGNIGLDYEAKTSYSVNGNRHRGREVAGRRQLPELHPGAQQSGRLRSPGGPSR